MFWLAIISKNPAAATVVAVIGVAIILIVAMATVAIILSARRLRRAGEALERPEPDPLIERMRRRPLIRSTKSPKTTPTTGSGSGSS